MKDQQMQFNYVGALLLYCGQQHVSSSHVAFFRVISLRTWIQL